jgi:dTMP kinase
VSPEAEMLMFAADRAQHVANLIRPALKAGKCVITDRFIDSTFAYQGYGRGLDIGQLKTIQNIATDGLVPHMTVWVDIAVKTSRSRMGLAENDRIESESDEMFEKVRSGYAELHSAYPERIIRVDGEKTIQGVFQDILKAVMPRIS